ncbi:hypothetical protein [Microbacterium sp. G2-8]|uniref:hypothetical protein n=1 Tax=Microbacterium sp. G2-8 TaxID=2842454 RepID=UPI001C89388D|nr:hypothetical protein [Microbacterium sp. G2-8]
MSKQRMISPEDLQAPEFRRVPHDAKPTAMGLWLHTDIAGRMELDPEVIAGMLYPGQDATELVIQHLLVLDETGFLTIYQASGREWIALMRPLKADPRGVRITTPPPPGSEPEEALHDLPWTSMAVGRAGASGRARAWERAREETRAEQAARAAAWAAVESDRREMPDRPERPTLLDAPPIGCLDHPDGHSGACGPCRDARLRRDVWLQERVYETKLAAHFEQTSRPVEFDGLDTGWDPAGAF